MAGVQDQQAPMCLGTVPQRRPPRCIRPDVVFLHEPPARLLRVSRRSCHEVCRLHSGRVQRSCNSLPLLFLLAVRCESRWPRQWRRRCSRGQTPPEHADTSVPPLIGQFHPGLCIHPNLDHVTPSVSPNSVIWAMCDKFGNSTFCS